MHLLVSCESTAHIHKYIIHMWYSDSEAPHSVQASRSGRTSESTNHSTDTHTQRSEACGQLTAGGRPAITEEDVIKCRSESEANVINTL